MWASRCVCDRGRGRGRDRGRGLVRGRDRGRHYGLFCSFRKFVLAGVTVFYDQVFNFILGEDQILSERGEM